MSRPPPRAASRCASPSATASASASSGSRPGSSRASATWTVVGLAEGTVGFNRLDKHLESLGEKDDKTTTDGRLALYAKGRIKGRWLLTLAYDSDKKRDDSRFAGVIDPTAYYTVYADRSEQRYDASSLRKLYLKLERPQFYALFGDYDTAIDEPVLTRYVRSLTGAKAEYRSDRVVGARLRLGHPDAPPPRRDPGQWPVGSLPPVGPQSARQQRADRDRDARPPALGPHRRQPSADPPHRL